jgi:hypothetical protein
MIQASIGPLRSKTPAQARAPWPAPAHPTRARYRQKCSGDGAEPTLTESGRSKVASSKEVPSRYSAFEGARSWPKMVAESGWRGMWRCGSGCSGMRIGQDYCLGLLSRGSAGASSRSRRLPRRRGSRPSTNRCCISPLTCHGRTSRSSPRFENSCCR